MPRRSALVPFTLATGALALAAGWVWRRTLWRLLESGLDGLVRHKLGGYRVRVNAVDTLKPVRLAEPAHVAVIGGGLAGVAAASTLAERGFEVTLYEANDYLGGKLGAWTHTFEDGEQRAMEHGFHAFFANYYNLNRWLSKLGIEQGFRTTSDYRILTLDGQDMSFAGLHRTPGLNLLHLATKGFFDWRETVSRNPNVDRLNDMLNYHPVDTFERLDDESYADYARAANLPSRMQLIFRSFTRVFFAEAEQMSMAELAKSFHGYFLSHDGGLMFRYPTDDHATSLWAPILAHLERVGVSVRLSKPVDAIERQKNGRLKVGGRPYDHVVLAADLPGVRRILDASAELVDDDAPALRDDIAALQPQNRYAVLRVWLDTDCRRDLPDFASTERRRALDSITTCHRAQRTWRDWVATHGGSVLELHSYSVPADLTGDAAIRDALMDDLRELLPELRDAVVEREVFYVKDDFTPFFVGMHKRRPGVRTAVDGLWFAGDWVKVPYPTMLMENAFTTGLLAANGILQAHDLRTEPVYSVPSEGILYGIR